MAAALAEVERLDPKSSSPATAGIDAGKTGDRLHPDYIQYLRMR